MPASLKSIFRCVVIFTLLFLVAKVQSQDTQDTDEAIPIVQPTRDLLLPDHESFTYTVDIPDSPSKILSYTTRSAINVWSLLVYYWPELVSLLFTMILLWRLWHNIKRRAMLVGEPHCRKCLYPNVQSDSTTCSECGHDLAMQRPFIGRHRGWRIAVSLLLLIALGGGYFIGCSRLPREGAFGNLIVLRSSRLCRWAFDHKEEWYTRHKANDHRFVEIDARTGAVSEEIRTKAGQTIMPEFSPSRDHAIAFNDPYLQLFNLQNGECLADLDLTDYAQEYLHAKTSAAFPAVMGIDPNILYLTSIDQQQGTKEVQAWNLPAGTIERLFIVESSDLNFLYYVRDEHTLGLLRFGFADQGWQWQEFDLKLKQFGKTLRSQSNSNLYYSFLLRADGCQFVLSEIDSGQLEVWDRKNGVMIKTIEAPVANLHLNTMSSNGRLVIAGSRDPTESPGFQPQTFVFDLEAGKCIAELKIDNKLFLKIVALPDEKTVVSIERDANNKRHLLVFDLDEFLIDNDD